MKDIITLGIESSCDETSVAVVKNGREVLSNVINSQIKIHEKFGGVVPEIASRNHVEAISDVTKKALEEAKITFDDIDNIACTYGPGLVGALLVGVSYAKALSYALNRMLNTIKNKQDKTSLELYNILETEAKKIHSEDVDICQKIGEYGAELLKENTGILTHCNAGRLAVSGIGTPLAPMYTAHKNGVKIRVYAD